MRLECVTTCVNYADFLACTLPLNRQAFDHLVVVTSPEDEETQRLCEFHYVECVVTDAFGSDGCFRKGAAINAGLERLALDGWVAHVDADIALPPQTRPMLDSIDLDPAMLYGCDRLNVLGYEEWRKYLRKPRLVHEADVYVHLDAFPVGTRFVWPEGHGYVPIGFFQLWHPGVSGVRSYPTEHTNAGRSDMFFAGQWPRHRRGMLPELVALHLESEQREQGANWDGRVTQPFEARGPIAALRRSWGPRWPWGHRHHHHHHHYWDPDRAEAGS